MFPTKDLFPGYLKNSLDSIVRKQIKNKQEKKNIQKMDQWLARHFTKENIKMANKHMKICPTFLANKNIQIKATVRCHYKLTKMLKLEKVWIILNDGEDAEIPDLSLIARVNVKWYIHSGNLIGSFFKSWTNTTCFSNFTLELHPR